MKRESLIVRQKSLTKNRLKQQNWLTISISPVGFQYDWGRTIEEKKQSPLSCQSVDFVILFGWLKCCFLCGFCSLNCCFLLSILSTLSYLSWEFDLQPVPVLGNFHFIRWLFSYFSILHGISWTLDFDCNTIVFCKMFRLYFLLIVCFFTVCQSCRLIVPAELLNGCIFDPMIVSVSHAGFSINRDNCNTAIAKHVFAEQPLIYYGRAKSVINVEKWLMLHSLYDFVCLFI